ERYERRPAARRVVEEQWTVQSPRQGLDLGLGGRRLDEEHVRARSGGGHRPLDRVFEPRDGDRVRPGNDQEIRIGPGVDGGPYAAGEFAPRHHLLAREVAAALRRDLVFEVERRDPRSLVLLDSASYLERAAVAGVGIGDEWDRNGGSQVPGLVGHLRQP